MGRPRKNQAGDKGANSQSTAVKKPKTTLTAPVMERTKRSTIGVVQYKEEEEEEDLHLGEMSSGAKKRGRPEKETALEKEIKVEEPVQSEKKPTYTTLLEEPSMVSQSAASSSKNRQGRKKAEPEVHCPEVVARVEEILKNAVASRNTKKGKPTKPTKPPTKASVPKKPAVRKMKPQEEKKKLDPKKKLPDSMSDDPLIRIRQCTTCFMICTNAEKLKRHNRTHTNTGQSQCPYCKTTIKFQYNLKSHMIRCSKEVEDEFGLAEMRMLYPEYVKQMMEARMYPHLPLPDLPPMWTLHEDGTVTGYDPRLRTSGDLLARSKKESQNLGKKNLELDKSYKAPRRSKGGYRKATGTDSDSDQEEESGQAEQEESDQDESDSEDSDSEDSNQEESDQEESEERSMREESEDDSSD